MASQNAYPQCPATHARQAVIAPSPGGRSLRPGISGLPDSFGKQGWNKKSTVY